MFFLLTIATSWIIYTILPVPGGLGLVGSDNPLAGILPFVKQFTPTLSGVLVARWAWGRDGARRMRKQAHGVKAPARWYAIVLVVFPALLLVGSAIISLVTDRPILHPDVDVAFIAGGILVIGLLGPIGEELYGWRGFALPQLLRRVPGLAAAVILGVAWMLWHTPPWGLLAQGLSISSALTPLLMTTSLCIVMLWVYYLSRNLLLSGVGMHVAFNSAGLFSNVPPMWSLGVLAIVATLHLLVRGRYARSAASTDVV